MNSRVRQSEGESGRDQEGCECVCVLVCAHSGVLQLDGHPLFVPLLPWVANVAKVLVLQMLWSVVKLPTYLCFLLGKTSSLLQVLKRSQGSRKLSYSDFSRVIVCRFICISPESILRNGKVRTCVCALVLCPDRLGMGHCTCVTTTSD